MLTFNRMLVYTHKFDKWEYVQLQDPNGTEYTTLPDLDGTQKKVFSYVSSEKEETAHYYQDGCYYRVVSTQQDLLQHIPYTAKDNRKHNMNLGVYEYRVSITSGDTIPIDILALALQLYIDGKSGCEVDMARFNALEPTYRQECIAKFLYIANELLDLKVYLKESQTSSVTPISNCYVDFSLVGSIINRESVYLTYINVFYYNLHYNEKILVDSTSITENTLKYILNTPNETIRLYKEPVVMFVSRCGVSITIDNVWSYIENHSIQNGVASSKVLGLPLTLEDILSVIVNTTAMGVATYNKYLEVLNGVSVETLQEFLDSTESIDTLQLVHDRLSPIPDKPSIDVNPFINSLRSIEYSSDSISTLVSLLESMCVSRYTVTVALTTVLTVQYGNLLSLQNLLLSQSGNALDNINAVLNYHYDDTTISDTLRESTETLYQQTFNRFMELNILTIDDTKRLNFMDKSILSIDSEDFESLAKLFYRLFLVHNPTLDFSKLSPQEKVLILCTPELLLRYIDYCDTTDSDRLLTELFQYNNRLINMGMLQIQYIKYVVGTVLEDTKTIPTTLTDLDLDLNAKKLKVYTKKLRKFLECLLRL